MRLFIVLDFPEELSGFIWVAGEKFRKQGFIDGNFTKKENIHLTLKFLGEVSEKNLEKIKNILAGIKKKKFTIKAGDFGFFGNRIFWIKLESEELLKLQKEIDEKLKDLFMSEERFMAHVTIARIKKTKNKQKVLEAAKKMTTDKEFEIQSFSLKKSTLMPKGTKYEDVLKVELL